MAQLYGTKTRGGVNTERGERELVKRKYKRLKANTFWIQEPRAKAMGPFSPDQGFFIELKYFEKNSLVLLLIHLI